ncbi:MAG: transglycosylase SLT domain-containing protein [Bacteroidota bacterium]
MKSLKSWGVIAAMVVGSNVATHFLFNGNTFTPQAGIHAVAEPAFYASGNKVNHSTKSADFYLADQAAQYIYDLNGFNHKVEDISTRLGIPKEWLLAVIAQESKFNPGIANFAGSGAVGLIQFMPATAREMGTSTYELQQMGAENQMEYVYFYLNTVKDRYGSYRSLTDLYLGILYPKARGTDACYTLFAKPSKSYKQNAGLDEDKDGKVTVSDIENHLKRKFPEAYMKNITA